MDLHTLRTGDSIFDLSSTTDVNVTQTTLWSSNTTPSTVVTHKEAYAAGGTATVYSTKPASTNTFNVTGWYQAPYPVPQPPCQLSTSTQCIFSADCDKCTIYGGTVSLLYFPVSRTTATSSLASASAGLRVPGNNLTGMASPTVTSSPTAPLTAIYEHTTLTSPSVYISFRTAYAIDDCGSQVGNRYPGAILALNQTDLSSVYGLYGTMYSTIIDPLAPVQTMSTPYLKAAPFDLADLNWPVPVSAYMNQPKFALGREIFSVVFDDYRPILAVPPQIRSIDPAWNKCALDWEGLYDPPKALQPAETIAGVTTAPGATHFTQPAAPSAELETPAIRTTSVAVVTHTSAIPLGGEAPDSTSVTDPSDGIDDNNHERGSQSQAGDGAAMSGDAATVLQSPSSISQGQVSRTISAVVTRHTSAIAFGLVPAEPTPRIKSEALPQSSSETDAADPHWTISSRTSRDNRPQPLDGPSISIGAPKPPSDARGTGIADAPTAMASSGVKELNSGENLGRLWTQSAEASSESIGKIARLSEDVEVTSNVQASPTASRVDPATAKSGSGYVFSGSADTVELTVSDGDATTLIDNAAPSSILKDGSIKSHHLTIAEGKVTASPTSRPRSTSLSAGEETLKTSSQSREKHGQASRFEYQSRTDESQTSHIAESGVEVLGDTKPTPLDAAASVSSDAAKTLPRHGAPTMDLASTVSWKADRPPGTKSAAGEATFTIAGHVHTATQEGSGEVLIGETTISAGGEALPVPGATLSVARDGELQMVWTASASEHDKFSSAGNSPVGALNVLELTMQSTTITARRMSGAPGHVSFDGQVLSAGGPAATVGGNKVSAVTNGVVVESGGAEHRTIEWTGSTTPITASTSSILSRASNPEELPSRTGISESSSAVLTTATSNDASSRRPGPVLPVTLIMLSALLVWF